MGFFEILESYCVLLGDCQLNAYLVAANEYLVVLHCATVYHQTILASLFSLLDILNGSNLLLDLYSLVPDCFEH